MTVHFKGTSDHGRRYKGRAHQKIILAGLRSDQNKITREPQFPSKRKVPFHPPQVSSSLKWEGRDTPRQGQERSRPVTPPAVKPAATTRGEEGQRTPLAPREGKPQEGTNALSRQQPERPKMTPGDQPKQGCEQNEVNHPLRKRAGLKSERKRNGRLSSEYQRQFMWKTPVADSPLLAAHEMFYNENQIIPPFKSNPVMVESEYRRSFKGSPPPRPLRLRRDVEQWEVPENITQERNKRKKKKERQGSRKSSPKKEQSLPKPEHQQPDVRSPCDPRDPSPKITRNAKTEYSSNFRSPLQFRYKDGAWVKARSAQVEDCGHYQWWYHEVQELRERAEAYRKRAWGTHFSRQHLNQIMSEHNWMWEPSSVTSSSSSVISVSCKSSNSSPIIEALDLASPRPSASVASSRRSSTGDLLHPEGPTLPVQRELAWDEKAKPGERKTEVLQKELDVRRKDVRNSEEIMENNKRLQVLETDSSSEAEGSINGGSLPTAKLKSMQTAQRTNHDRSIPATGGALQLSPPSIKKSFQVRKNESPSRKPHSPYSQIVDGSLQPTNKAVNRKSSPAAGLTTVDLLPIRDDAWSDEEIQYSNPRQAKPSLTHDRQRPRALVSSPVNRIQGTLRNPEFQHNGNLGIFRPELFTFPQSDSAVSDNDDKMSQISYRSATSCSMASEILDRAQRRKDDFWGKC